VSLPFETVAIIGLGYIGLPTAAVLANRGFKVLGVDIDPRTVATINRGEIHIVEPDLGTLVHDAIKIGALRACTQPELADAFVIAVPTPFKGNHEPDLSFVEAAARSIAPHLRQGNLVILESTCPVGTTEQMAAWLADSRPDLSFPHLAHDDADIQIAYCPERVLPGKILSELIENDRVLGGLSGKCSERAMHFYRSFVRGKCHLTNARTAEMCKLTENAFRDVNVAFANEISIVAETLGVNVWELIRLANHHPRVNILQPGPGVGGHCIAVDPWFIVHSAPAESRVIKAAREVNDSKPDYIVQKVRKAIRAFTNPTIVCLGLAFKANVDDLRESPAVAVVEKLQSSEAECSFLIVEPFISQLPGSLVRENTRLGSVPEALELADVFVVLVDHDAFKAIDVKQLEGRPIVDSRGLFLGKPAYRSIN